MKNGNFIKLYLKQENQLNLMNSYMHIMNKGRHKNQKLTTFPKTTRQNDPTNQKKLTIKDSFFKKKTPKHKLMNGSFDKASTDLLNNEPCLSSRDRARTKNSNNNNNIQRVNNFKKTNFFNKISNENLIFDTKNNLIKNINKRSNSTRNQDKEKALNKFVNKNNNGRNRSKHNFSKDLHNSIPNHTISTGTNRRNNSININRTMNTLHTIKPNNESLRKNKSYFNKVDIFKKFKGNKSTNNTSYKNKSVPKTSEKTTTSKKSKNFSLNQSKFSVRTPTKYSVSPFKKFKKSAKIRMKNKDDTLLTSKSLDYSDLINGRNSIFNKISSTNFNIPNGNDDSLSQIKLFLNKFIMNNNENYLSFLSIPRILTLISEKDFKSKNINNGIENNKNNKSIRFIFMLTPSDTNISMGVENYEVKFLKPKGREVIFSFNIINLNYCGFIKDKNISEIPLIRMIITQDNHDTDQYYLILANSESEAKMLNKSINFCMFLCKFKTYLIKNKILGNNE